MTFTEGVGSTRVLQQVGLDVVTSASVGVCAAVPADIALLFISCYFSF